MASPFSLTPEGFESQLASDHLGHFVLTNHLMPKILKATTLPSSSPVRIVNVSSIGNRVAGIRWTDPNFAEPNSYGEWEAYGQAKTANVLFTIALNARFARAGYRPEKIRAYALHPGSIATGLQKYVTPELAAEGAIKVFGSTDVLSYKRKTLQEGCATTLRAALDPGLVQEEGVYLKDCQLTTDENFISPWASNEADAER